MLGGAGSLTPPGGAGGPPLPNGGGLSVIGGKPLAGGPLVTNYGTGGGGIGVKYIGR